MTILKELSLLLFPRACAGCGAFDTALCGECARALAGEWREVSGRAPYLQEIVPTMVELEGLTRPGDAEARFPVFALGAYRGVRRRAIVRWKNTVDVELSATIADLVRARARQLFSPAPSGRPRASVVPAPSARARVRDGRFVAGVLAEAVASGMRAAGWDASVACCLAKRAGSWRNTWLGAPSGRGNRKRGSRWGDGGGHGGGQLLRGTKAKSIELARGRERAEGIVVLVDDVLTTGATLAGCAQALEGAPIGCAVVLAAAADPREKNVTYAASNR